MAKTELTDQQWNKIAPLLPRHVPRPKGGRPPRSDRECFEGILWILRSGARWKDLPREYPSPSTCWRRLRDWEEAEVWVNIWHAFLDELDEQGRLSWEETFADATFAPAKKGALASETPSVEKVQSAFWWQAAKEFLWRPWSNRPRRRR